MGLVIVGVDPGRTGAVVVLESAKMNFHVMPLQNDEVSFEGFLGIMAGLPKTAHVFLERAMPLAMGAKHAFNYGRGFAALEIAIRLSGLAVTYVEPGKWAKVMHAGISVDLKPKAKSLIAVERLFPQHLSLIPRNKNGKLHEGVVDALLIAGFGVRTIIGDF